MWALLIAVILQVVDGSRIAVTGAAGYLGAETVWQACAQGHSVRAVLRRHPSTLRLPPEAEVVVVDDLADMATARESAEGVDAVIHTASVFRQCADMETELVQPNIALAEAMVCACAASGARLVLTSSMAAVRGAGQLPGEGRSWYTPSDWNSVSRREGPRFEPYQWSKMHSERRAWELAREVGLEMTALCPSMIFGPPRDTSCTAFSVEMVRRWVAGKGAVESRLVADVRDVARAHVNAAILPEAAGQRYIVSCEARVPAQQLACAIAEVIGEDEVARRGIHADEGFAGGAVSIGDREVDASHLEALGVCCRPTSQTIADMAQVLCESQVT